MMRRKTLRKKLVHGLQLIFTTTCVTRVISLSAGDYGQARDQNQLKKLATVVLKYVADAVLRCEFLIFPYARKDAL